MYKILAASIITAAALVGCSTSSTPAPTVTVTQEVPKTQEPQIKQKSNSEKFVDFVRENGGVYTTVAEDYQLIDLGNIVCDGYAKGLSQDDIVMALSYALVENGMNNEQGATFAGALIVGAERYLCGRSV